MQRTWFARGAVLAFLALMGSAAPSRAAFTVTGYAFGSEGPAIVGFIVEDFEDQNLIAGLTIRMGGTSIATPRMWTGTIPRTWDPTTAAGGTFGGPFTANTWDGTHALTNGGHGVGQTGHSPGDGNYWDFNFADSVVFVFNPPAKAVGMGLSNFQSPGGPTPLTNHSLAINGVQWGLVESLTGWAPGGNVRNRYVVITASGADAIQSIAFHNLTAADGLVFDKLAVPDPTSGARPGSWGRLKSLYR